MSDPKKTRSRLFLFAGGIGVAVVIALAGPSPDDDDDAPIPAPPPPAALSEPAPDPSAITSASAAPRAEALLPENPDCKPLAEFLIKKGKERNCEAPTFYFNAICQKLAKTPNCLQKFRDAADCAMALPDDAWTCEEGMVSTKSCTDKLDSLAACISPR